MFRALRMLKRLWRAGRVLGAYDVLPPREWIAFAPPPLRAVKSLGFFRKDKKRAVGRSGERLTHAFTELGPSYIKLGQFLATRPDVIGADIARDLAELQDRLPPFSLSEARKILSEELNADALASIGDLSEPIAAASIAQVHKVALTPEVPGAPSRYRALKILRPGVERAFAEDIEAFAWAARLIERTGAEARRLRPVALIDTLCPAHEHVSLLHLSHQILEHAPPARS